MSKTGGKQVRKSRVPNSEATQFKPGQSGNPNGRPKKLPGLDELLIEVLTEEQKGVDGAKAILLSVRNRAIQGDMRAAEIMLDRAYGKVKQIIDQNITTEQPLFPDVKHKRLKE